VTVHKCFRVNKRNNIILFFLLLSKAVFAQTGKIQYEFKEPSLTAGANTINAILEYQDSLSLFSYYKISLADSNTMISNSFFDPNKGAALYVSEYDERGVQVYRNFKSKTVIFRQSKVKPLEPFIVNDDWIIIKWQITDKKKTILGYECRKATGTFRGREYTAWFATSIPVPYGPWKLYGLPGLILEAYDKKKMVHFTAKKIVLSDTSISDLLLPPSETIIKTIKEYAYYEDYYMENVEKAFQQSINKFVKEEGSPGNHITIKMDEQTKTTPEKIKLQRKFSLESKWEWEDEKEESSKIDLNLD